WKQKTEKELLPRAKAHTRNRGIGRVEACLCFIFFWCSCSAYWGGGELDFPCSQIVLRACQNSAVMPFCVTPVLNAVLSCFG
ncbi:hypothetical protein COCCADRAFT_81298, partial [Bipolaris zeicola 26-R-13]